MIDPEPPCRRGDCPPSTVLEFLAAGDPVDGPVHDHVGACSLCAGYVDALQRAHRDFQGALPGATFVRTMEARDGRVRPARVRSRWLLGLIPLAAVAAGLWMVLPSRPPAPGLLLKGSSPFAIYVRRGDMEVPRPLVSGSRVHAGDVLRFRYEPGREGYVMVVNIDGTGRLTAFYPFGRREALAVKPTPDNVLPGAVSLDAQPGAERIGAIFRPRPFTLDEVQSWLAPNGSGGVPNLTCADCEAHWMVLEK